ncbi:hypothetical protein Ddye_011485 [Dipteronia dyeriana]|uniref:Phytocyanin domain-containing protein n=1 Tax=Dipteronia dyeriana TaxID=168575 RepID=A0AAD9X2M1_9ROSI|nr:hypothetical protein Ddye_011485 [Dipteronia dyeriana]
MAKFVMMSMVFAVVLLKSVAAPTVHVVGDSMGWDVPNNDDTAAFNTWAATKQFVVGDILTFNFASNSHDVQQVPKASYDACTASNPIGTLITTGPANITLDSPGDHYYICTIGRYCQFSQKLSISVSAIPGASPSPTLPTTTTPPTTPSPNSGTPEDCTLAPTSGPTASSPGGSTTPPGSISTPGSSSTAVSTVHVVGDSMGWDVPNNGDIAAFNTWAATKQFVVGDILTFNFASNSHDVQQVPKASYDACTASNPIGTLITTGPANVTLDSPGDHYYICTIGRHCQFGQKLSISVSATPGASPSPTPPTTTTPPTTPSPNSGTPEDCTPAPTSGPTPSNQGGSTTPPGPASTPGSSSPAASVGILVPMMAVVMGFFF